MVACITLRQMLTGVFIHGWTIGDNSTVWNIQFKCHIKWHSDQQTVTWSWHNKYNNQLYNKYNIHLYTMNACNDCVVFFVHHSIGWITTDAQVMDRLIINVMQIIYDEFQIISFFAPRFLLVVFSFLFCLDIWALVEWLQWKLQTP